LGAGNAAGAGGNGFRHGSFRLKPHLRFEDYMSSDKVQFNPRISEKYKRQAKVDAAKTGQTVEVVAETIYANFFDNFSEQEREKLYLNHPASKKPRQKV
jgi:hypothetical protein